VHALTSQACADALLAAGLDPAVPTRWVAESLLTHLPRDVHADLFAMAARLGGGTGSAFSVALEPSNWEARSPCPTLLPAALDTAEDTLATLEAAGWRTAHITRAADFEHMYGRVPNKGFAIISALSEAS
jgi:O-methyltransferase involved in polyketide biosynthesis